MPTPKMMPGQEPYTPAELDQLHDLVADAAAGDPGEADEPAMCVNCHTIPAIAGEDFCRPCSWLFGGHDHPDGTAWNN